jgi:hypothetical protein
MPNRIPLQPAASPVDQFYLPNVAKPAQTNGLLQLAGALASVRPELQQILDNRAQAFVNRGPVVGEAEIRRLHLDNQQKLKDAVAKGLIREGDNPWVMLAVKQGVARVEAESAASQMLDEYYKSGLSTEDDLSKVQGFATKFMQEKFSDRDPDELKAIAPVVEQSINRLTSMHVQQRADDRVQEAQTTIETLTAQYGQDLKSATDPNQKAAIITQYEQAMVPLKAGLSWTKINDAKLRGAATAALAAKDVSVYDAIVGNIQTPGGSYANSAPAKLARERLLSNIQEQDDRDFERQQRMEKYHNEQILQAYLKSYQQQLNDARKSNPNAGPEDIGWSIKAIESWDIPEDVKDELWGRIFNRLQAKEAAQGLDHKQAYQNAISKLLDKKTTITAQDMEAVSTGLDATQRLDLTHVATELNSFHSQDTREGLDKIIELRQQPGGPTVQDLKTLRDGGQISQDTFMRESEKVMNTRSALPIGFGEVLRADGDSLSNLVITANNTLKLPNEQWAQQDFDGFIAAHTEAQTLENAFNDQFFAVVDQDPDHSYAHLSEVKNSIRDRLIKQFKDLHAAPTTAPSSEPKLSPLDRFKQRLSANKTPITGTDSVISKVKALADIPAEFPDFIKALRAKSDINVTPGLYAAVFHEPVPDLMGSIHYGADPVGDAVSALRRDRQYFSTNYNSPSNAGVTITTKDGKTLTGDAAKTELIKTDAKTQLAIQQRVIAHRQAAEQRLIELKDKANNLLTSDQDLTYKDKVFLFAYDRLRLRTQESILAGGYTPEEAKQTFGDQAWKQVPLFVGQAQIEVFKNSAAQVFGIKPGTPEFNQFVATQIGFVSMRNNHFNP